MVVLSCEVGVGQGKERRLWCRSNTGYSSQKLGYRPVILHQDISLYGAFALG